MEQVVEQVVRKKRENSHESCKLYSCGIGTAVAAYRDARLSYMDKSLPARRESCRALRRRQWTQEEGRWRLELGVVDRVKVRLAIGMLANIQRGESVSLQPFVALDETVGHRRSAESWAQLEEPV